MILRVLNFVIISLYFIIPNFCYCLQFQSPERFPGKFCKNVLVEHTRRATHSKCNSPQSFRYKSGHKVGTENKIPEPVLSGGEWTNPFRSNLWKIGCMQQQRLILSVCSVQVVTNRSLQDSHRMFIVLVVSHTTVRKFDLKLVGGPKLGTKNDLEFL